MPENPNIDWRTGWRSECMKPECQRTGSEYIQWLELVIDSIYLPTDDNNSTSIRTIFAGWQYGLAQSIDLGNGMITNSHKSTMDLKLNHNLTYQILIMDPKMQIISDQPRTFPITRLSLEHNGVKQVYLKVLLKRNVCM